MQDNVPFYSRTGWREAKKQTGSMRTLTAYWIGVVIVLAVLNGIRALPAGSRAWRSMRNMGIAAAVLGTLAIIALKSGSQNATRRALQMLTV